MTDLDGVIRGTQRRSRSPFLALCAIIRPCTELRKHDIERQEMLHWCVVSVRRHVEDDTA